MAKFIRLINNVVTRETFENTDSGKDVTYFESMDELLEDLDDLAVVAERQSEETISQAELERELEHDR